MSSLFGKQKIVLPEDIERSTTMTEKRYGDTLFCHDLKNVFRGDLILSKAHRYKQCMHRNQDPFSHRNYNGTLSWELIGNGDDHQ